MGELVADNSISPFIAILWCFYPMAAVVLLELFSRAIDDDVDDVGGGGVMTPVYQGAAS